jgi:hypothetical protein
MIYYPQKKDMSNVWLFLFLPILGHGILIASLMLYLPRIHNAKVYKSVTVRSIKLV